MCRKPHSMSETSSPIGGDTNGSGNLSTMVYFFLVGGCAPHLQNPATKCDLPIG
jgi:hypothetical protein